MKLETRKKVGKALAAVGGIGIGTVTGMAVSRMAKSLFPDNKVAQLVAIGVGSIGGICYMFPVADSVSSAITEWVYKPTEQELKELKEMIAKFSEQTKEES
jgi:hypothetical protein